MDTLLPAVIYPPQDDNLRGRLEAKLKEYETRKAGKGEPWETMHPELAYLTQAAYRDACHKVDVLSAVLSATAETPVDTSELSKKLSERYGEAFNIDSFSNACGVITNYLGVTSFPFVSPGTGLPERDAVDTDGH